jgi:hypothetical protein
VCQTELNEEVTSLKVAERDWDAAKRGPKGTTWKIDLHTHSQKNTRSLLPDLRRKKTHHEMKDFREEKPLHKFRIQFHSNQTAEKIITSHNDIPSHHRILSCVE